MKILLLLFLALSLFGGDFEEMKKAFEKGNTDRAIAIARINAMKGDVTAMYDLGLLYYAKGSTKKAVNWLERSVKNGGKGELGISIILFSQSRSREGYQKVTESLVNVEKSPIRSALMAVSRDLSANRREASAKDYLAVAELLYGDKIIFPDLRMALFLTNQAAKKSDAKAMELMGDAYWRSTYTSESPIVAPQTGNALNVALEYYNDASGLGNLDAMAKMGKLHIIGPRNVRRIQYGVELILKSANGGSPLGAQMAAELYLEGQGVRADRQQALEWYAKATEICEVNKILANLYRQGEEADRYAAAYKKCANTDMREGQYHLLFEPF